MEIPLPYHQPEEGFDDIPDGKLFYRKTGEGPVLVFIHGFGLDSRMWQQQVFFFSARHTCISYDLRGFGKSSVPLTPYTHQDDLKIMLESLRIDKPVVLIGLSMGGRVATNFCLAYPEKIKAMVLADIAVDGYPFEHFKLDDIYEAGKTSGIPVANKMWLDHEIFNPAKRSDAVAAALKEMVLSYSGWHWANKNPVQNPAVPAVKRLHEIKTPVLVVVGEEDIYDFQQIAVLLHRNISGSVLRRIAEAGHMCNMEKPDEFNLAVERFLASVE